MLDATLTPVQLGTAEHLTPGWTAAPALTVQWALNRKAERAAWGDPEEDEENYVD